MRHILVDWHDDVQPYLASDDGVVGLLSDTHRWSVGPRSILTASPLLSRSRIKRGIELPGSDFIPVGGSYADGGAAGGGVIRHDSR